MCTLIPAPITKTTGAQQKDMALQPGVQGEHLGVPRSQHHGQPPACSRSLAPSRARTGTGEALSMSLEFMP